MTATELEQARLDTPSFRPRASGLRTVASRSSAAPMDKRVLYVCNTFGQPDHDRCTALARSGWTVMALDWSRDDTGYIWEKTAKDFKYKEIHVSSRSPKSNLSGFLELISSTSTFNFDVAIIYGFHNPAFFALAAYIRLQGKDVVAMYDSRFSDYSRSLTKDFLKKFMFLPYSACLAASDQSAEYARYLGFKKIEVYRCAIDGQRIRKLSREAYETTAFGDRSFICVSRFVEKKNLAFMLQAYTKYAAAAGAPRRLVLVGYGDLRDEILKQIEGDPNLASRVVVLDYVPASELPNLIGGAIGLVLPSTTDQFGIVVTEALAAGVPAIVSANCGAAELIAPWVNGVVVNPRSLEDIARAFAFIDCDEREWKHLSQEAEQSSHAGDVEVFLGALDRLLPVRA